MKRRTNLWPIAVLTIISALVPGAQRVLPASATQNQGALAGNCAVEIISPRPGDRVGQSTTVKGTAKIPAEGFLWVLARKKSMGNQWWPQAGGPVEIESGQWEAEVFFGRLNDVGSRFEVAAVVVNRQTNEDLVKWFASAKALDYPPIPFPNNYGCPVVTVKVEKTN